MKLVEAYSKIIEFANVPFKEYLSEAVIKDNMLKIRVKQDKCWKSLLD